jgi:hypothetical protein
LLIGVDHYWDFEDHIIRVMVPQLCSRS